MRKLRKPKRPGVTRRTIQINAGRRILLINDYAFTSAAFILPDTNTSVLQAGQKWSAILLEQESGSAERRTISSITAQRLNFLVRNIFSGYYASASLHLTVESAFLFRDHCLDIWRNWFRSRFKRVQKHHRLSRPHDEEMRSRTSARSFAHISLVECDIISLLSHSELQCTRFLFP